MKELVDIHVFLVSEEILGDWDGQAAEVADKVNMLLHLIYDRAPDDIEAQSLIRLLESVLPVWCQDDAILDADEYDLISWVDAQLDNLVITSNENDDQ